MKDMACGFILHTSQAQIFQGQNTNSNYVELIHSTLSAAEIDYLAILLFLLQEAKPT